MVEPKIAKHHLITSRLTPSLPVVGEKIRQYLSSGHSDSPPVGKEYAVPSTRGSKSTPPPMYEPLHNRKELRDRRRRLRNNATPEERYLWQYLRKRQLRGRKFRRQHSIGPFIVDFYCPAERLAVELDGAAHNTEEARQYDRDRTLFLREQRIRVLRFYNREVLENTEDVLRRIAGAFEE